MNTLFPDKTENHPAFIPGECHAHMFMNGTDYKKAVRTHEHGVNEEALRENLAAYKKCGITFVREGGDKYGVSTLAKHLAPEYGIDYRSPVFAIHKNGYYGGIVGFGFDDIKEYAGLVRKVKEQDGDFIKIMASGILDFDEFGKVSTPLNEPELIKEMVHIAHEEGFAVMVHVNTPRQIGYALTAGCDSIEHGYYMNEECLQIMKQTGAVWVPTLATCANLRRSTRFNAEAVEKITDFHMKMISRALAEGVLVAPGSDAGAFMVPHGQGAFDEVEEMREGLVRNGIDDAILIPALEKGLNEIKRRFKRS